MMRQQASLDDRNIVKTVHSHDHKVCGTPAKAYAMLIVPQLAVQSKPMELHLG